MNTAQQVDLLITQWIQQGLTKPEIVVKTAEGCMGWPYVYGAAGQDCTPSTRRGYAKNYEQTKPAEAKVILNRCQVCRESNPKATCSGCAYYPGAVVRCFDCRGFTRWTLKQVGITIQGAGATSQWNTDSNWTQKGKIADMPDVVCCVFMANGNTMEHTGLHVGGGKIIHCSGTVKSGKTTDKGWTHYALVKGLEGTMPTTKPTLRRGDRGEYVTLAQTELIQKGYNVGSSGADGIFGKNTETAVKALQKDNGLVQDGIIGQKTWAVLDSVITTLYTVTIPHLTLTQADALVAQYPGSTKTEERGLTLK